MVTVWARFARTGNPRAKDLIEWPARDEAHDPYLYISATLDIKSAYSNLAKIQPRNRNYSPGSA